MSDYGVDTPDWTPLPWSWAAARLGQGRNYWVVTASASGRPARPAGVGRLGRRRAPLRLLVRAASRKAANVAANPQVTVAVDDTVECVSVEGRADVVEDERRGPRGSSATWRSTRRSRRPSTADFIRENLVVELVPERAFGIIEREEEFAARATRWRFPAG